MRACCSLRLEAPGDRQQPAASSSRAGYVSGGAPSSCAFTPFHSMHPNVYLLVQVWGAHSRCSERGGGGFPLMLAKLAVVVVSLLLLMLAATADPKPFESKPLTLNR